MTREQLTNALAAGAEDARFQDWSRGRTIAWKFVYLCEYGTIWRFGPKEWWKFVIKTIRNNGAYDLPLSTALRRRPKNIFLEEFRKCTSSETTLRCVNPLDWTVEDWKKELI
jgi:hypothetical protein